MSHNSAWLNLGPLFFFSFFFLLFFDIPSCSLFSLFFCWKKFEASPNLTSTNRWLLNMQHWLRMRSRWFGIYWPHSFSFLWTEKKLRWIKMQQRIHEWGQYPVILTTETNLGQERIYCVGKKRTFSCLTNKENPKWARAATLPTRVANQLTGFSLSCPLVDSAI